jgi:hypothetical protein
MLLNKTNWGIRSQVCQMWKEQFGRGRGAAASSTQGSKPRTDLPRNERSAWRTARV